MTWNLAFAPRTGLAAVVALPVALTMALFTTACSDAVAPSTEVEPSFDHRPGHGGGPGPAPIPLNAIFRDGAADGVRSDGGGPYDAEVMENGNFSLFKSDVRQLCFDFPDDAIGTPFDDQPGKAGCDNGYSTTAEPDLEGGLRAMGVGSTMTTRGGVVWVMQDPADGKGYNWFLRYGGDCNANSVPANRLTVAHPDADTWTLEGAAAFLCKMPVKGKPQVLPVGAYAMPWFITAARKP